MLFIFGTKPTKIRILISVNILNTKMLKNARVKQSVGGAVLVGILATLIGGSSISPPTNQNATPSDRPKPGQTQLHYSRLQQLIDGYNDGDIRKKDMIINKLYNEKARLISFPYRNLQKGISKKFGNATITIEGIVNVKYSKPGEEISEFNIENTPINLLVAEDGRIRRPLFPVIIGGTTIYYESGGEIIQGEYGTIKIPPGYSVLKVKGPLNQAHVPEMLWALSLFGKTKPGTGIPSDIEAVTLGLARLGHYPIK